MEFLNLHDLDKKLKTVSIVMTKSIISLTGIMLISLYFSFTLLANTKIENLTTSNSSKDTNKDFNNDFKEVTVTSPNATREIPNELGKHSIGIGLGQTFLLGNFAKTGDSEITWDLYYNYTASHSFDLLVNFHTANFEKANLGTKLTGTAVAIKAKLFDFDNFAPVGFAGLGFYWPQVTRNLSNNNQGIKESSSKVVFGHHFGGGVELKLNQNVSTGVLLHYHNPFDLKQDADPDVEGSYYKLLITLFYTI